MMNKKTFIKIICILLFLYIDAINAYSQETIWKAKGRLIYLVAKNDTAILEYFDVDKPIMAYKIHDTLRMKDDKSQFSNKKTTIVPHTSGGFGLITSDTFLSKRDLLFFPITKKELREWNRRYNTISYQSYQSLLISKINDELIKNGDKKLFENFKNDWKELGLDRYRLDRTLFEKKIEQFKTKYNKL